MTKPQYKVRANAVHQHLSKLGLTVSDLAAELGVTLSAGYQYLKPHRRLNPTTRQKLMQTKALRGLPFDEMFERVDVPASPPMSPTNTSIVSSPISASEVEQASYNQGFRAAIGVALQNAGYSREDLNPLRGDVLVGGSYIIRQDATVQAWEMLRAKVANTTYWKVCFDLALIKHRAALAAVRAELSPRSPYAVGTRLHCLDGYEGIVVTDPGGESRIVVAVEGRESGEEFWNPRFIVTAAEVGS